MKVVYARFAAGGRERYGIVSGKSIAEVTPHYFGPYRRTGRRYPLAKVRLLAPCRPGKVVALGLNYLVHARELRMPIPLHPLLFLKAPSAVIGPGDPIVRPAASRRVDHEAELAVVIGKRAKDVPPARAYDHILGYTCCNDVTARDLQKVDGQWARAKSFDTFAPLGPWIVGGIDPADLAITARVNGKVRQRSSTAELIFKVDEIVSAVSQVMTLFPGDVIATGTPPGVGPLAAGDRVEVRIAKIGSLTNPVV